MPVQGLITSYRIVSSLTASCTYNTELTRLYRNEPHLDVINIAKNNVPRLSLVTAVRRCCIWTLS